MRKGYELNSIELIHAMQLVEREHPNFHQKPRRSHSLPMNKTEFIKQLRATAEEIKPLTESAAPGALTWNGTEYAKVEAKKLDPHALAWWSMLGAIAELIEAQESPLSPKQAAYLDRTLFGSMGSLNDLYFDPKFSGSIANIINERLDERRRALFTSFKG